MGSTVEELTQPRAGSDDLTRRTGRRSGHDTLDTLSCWQPSRSGPSSYVGDKKSLEPFKTPGTLAKTCEFQHDIPDQTGFDRSCRCRLARVRRCRAENASPRSTTSRIPDFLVTGLDRRGTPLRNVMSLLSFVTSSGRISASFSRSGHLTRQLFWPPFASCIDLSLDHSHR